MNDIDRELVRLSIESIGDDINTISQSFYRILLLEHPRFSRVFSGSVESLNTKFFNMIALFKNVKHLEAISTSVREVGRRHFDKYNVKPEYLMPVKQALLQALKEYFGDELDERTHAAWDHVYEDVAKLFMESEPERKVSSDITPQPIESDVADSLMTLVGGREAILNIHMKFYDTIFDHPLLGQFFRGKHEATLARKQTDFMVAAFGGENNYKGDTPAFVHMHMYITSEQLELRETLLKNTLLAEGLSDDVVERWLNVDRRFWPGIAKKSVDECVLKCKGQVPIVAE